MQVTIRQATPIFLTVAAVGAPSAITASPSAAVVFPTTPKMQLPAPADGAPIVTITAVS